MIQANELRIGNLVIYSEDGSLCEVLGIDKMGISVNVLKTQEITWIELDQFEPIVLLPEILEKCGFAMLHHLGKLQPTLQIDESLEFHWAEDTLFVTYSEDNYDENIELGGFTIERPLRHIKHLHQLQNYIYFETNTELTFKPLR